MLQAAARLGGLSLILGVLYAWYRAMSIVESLKEPSSAALFFTTVAVTFAIFYFLFGRDNRPQVKDLPPPPTPRNWTLQQLKVSCGQERCGEQALRGGNVLLVDVSGARRSRQEFNGEDDKPIYVAVNGEVGASSIGARRWP